MRFLLFGIASMATMLATHAIHLPQKLNGIPTEKSPFKNPFRPDSMMPLKYDESNGLSLPQLEEINAQSYSTGGTTGTKSSIDNQNSLPPSDHSAKTLTSLSQALQDIRDKNDMLNHHQIIYNPPVG